MKATMIVFNQANTQRVEYLLDTLEIRGYTWWNSVLGRGSETGTPKMGTHTWPEMNSAVLTVIPESKVEKLLQSVNKLDEVNSELGIRAFVWNVEQAY